MKIRCFLLTRFLEIQFNKTLGQVSKHPVCFKTHGRAFQTSLYRNNETLRKNWKLSRKFEKLGCVFVSKHGICSPISYGTKSYPFETSYFKTYRKFPEKYLSQVCFGFFKWKLYRIRPLVALFQDDKKIILDNLTWKFLPLGNAVSV